MVFKINMSEKNGRTFKIESDKEDLVGKSLHDKVEGTEISPELGGYEFEITGASDIAGFPSMEDVEGVGLEKGSFGFWKRNEKTSKKRRKKIAFKKQTERFEIEKNS